MKTLVKHTSLYYFLQFTWGIIMNIIGGGMALFMLITGHKPHKYGPAIYFRCHHMDGFGFSLGIFFVIGKTTDAVKEHEFGHTIQNIMFGPIAPFIVYIPSFVRYQYFNFKYWKKGLYAPIDYNSIWFEKQATILGNEYICLHQIMKGNWNE